MISYEYAIEELKKSSLRGSRLGLERMKLLMKLLGDPQDKLKVIHVAGTNGKGSFCAMLGSVMNAAGYKVGMFSSPFMLSPDDSFRINGNVISNELFAETFGEIIAVSEKMDDKPTEFEMLAAAAYLMFYHENCDFALIECGMGGDGDATNVISKPVLSVITNVTVDHCAFLGDTVSEIAMHKSGIIKEGCPVLFGGDDKQSEQVIMNAANKKNTPLYYPENDKVSVEESGLSRSIISYKGLDNISVSLAGECQIKNAANVLKAVEILKDNGVEISDKALREGLEKCHWNGRFEVLSEAPMIVFDGAHNEDGMASACKSIREYFPNQKVTLLIGVLADKNYSAYANMLDGLVSCVFAVSPDNPRALDSKTLAECFEVADIRSKACDSIENGFSAAYSYAKKNDEPLIVLGSLYMYKDIVKAVGGIKQDKNA